MKLVDYTGKLNSHGEYLNVLSFLEQKSSFIEYVLITDDYSFVEKFKDDVILAKEKNKWWGTKSARKNKIYRIKASKNMFKYLKEFDTFCKYSITKTGDVSEETDFGINDIAFFDSKNSIPLLFTTTHEGYITIRDDLLN